MATYDVVGGKVIDAPASVQRSWNEFQGDKAPMSSAKDYRAQAAASGGQWKEDAKLNKFKG